MLIRLTKQGSRNKLTCVRADGTFTQVDLGPRLPYHDLAHYVAEKMLKLERGFYGNIRDGFSIEQLSDKDVIRTLEPESMVAEIIARNVQLLGSGTSDAAEFVHLVAEEMQHQRHNSYPELNTGIIDLLKSHYLQLVQEWDALPEGQTLELVF